MLTIITLIGVLTVLGLAGLLLNLVYPLNTKVGVWLAGVFVRKCPKMAASIFNAYLHFRFVFDSENTDKLPQQFLIVSNHQSLLDILLFLYAMPDRELRFVAKEELAHYVPLISQILRIQKHGIIQRQGSTAQTMRRLDTFADRVVARGQIPVIFPEGTRSRDGSLGTFNAAGFRRILGRQPMPVAVCAIEGGYKLATLDGIFRFLRNGTYLIKVVKIFPAPNSKQEQVAILEESKALIQAQLDIWRQDSI